MAWYDWIIPGKYDGDKPLAPDWFRPETGFSPFGPRSQQGDGGGEGGGPPPPQSAPPGVQAHAGWQDSYAGAYGSGGGRGMAPSFDVRSYYSGESPYDRAYKNAIAAVAAQRAGSDKRIQDIYATATTAHRGSTPEVQAMMSKGQETAKTGYQSALDNIRATGNEQQALLAQSAANKGIAPQTPGAKDVGGQVNNATAVTTNRLASEQAAGQQRFGGDIASMAKYHDAYGKSLGAAGARDRARLEAAAAMKTAELELALAQANAGREDRMTQMQAQYDLSMALGGQAGLVGASNDPYAGFGPAQRSSLMNAANLANQIYLHEGKKFKYGNKDYPATDLSTRAQKEAWLAGQDIDTGDPYVQRYLDYWHNGNDPGTFPYK